MREHKAGRGTKDRGVLINVPTFCLAQETNGAATYGLGKAHTTLSKAQGLVLSYRKTNIIQSFSQLVFLSSDRCAQVCRTSTGGFVARHATDVETGTRKNGAYAFSPHASSKPMACPPANVPSGSICKRYALNACFVALL